MALPTGASVCTFDLVQYPHVPHFYEVDRTVTTDQEQLVKNAIHIAPPHFAIITDILDSALASRLAPTVLQVPSQADAATLAASLYETDGRSIIVGAPTSTLIGFYEDRQERIPLG